MKKLTILLVPVVLLAGCKKHNSVGVSPAPALDSITLYSPSHQMKEVETFRFSGDLLTTFTDKVLDTVSAGVEVETVVHSFYYSGGGTSPDSVLITDTLLNVAGEAYVPATTYSLAYNGQGRLVAGNDAASCCFPQGWSWIYSGDSIYIYESFTSSPPTTTLFDQLVEQNGDLTGYRIATVTPGQLQNPLYDATIGRVFGPYFYSVSTWFVPQVGFNVYPVDFISQHLPVELIDARNGYTLNFSWQVGPDGRVTGASVADTSPSPYGPMQISFGYSQ